jgi:hypothetical protein
MIRQLLSGCTLRVLAMTLALFTVAGLGNGTYAEVFTQGTETGPFHTLTNGEYSWHPEISPAGPVVIIVSIPMQRLFVYRNGVRIGKSTVSTGRAGHPTPTGVFTILQKQVDHTSTIYKGAEMPYMERLTWGGIALHAGWLPGYSDSHGCVRLPLEFAKKLYTVTGKGTTVMITDGSPTPVSSSHPGYILSAQGNNTAEKADAGDFQWEPQAAPTGPVSIIVSTKSSRIYVFRDGVEIGRAPVLGGEDMEIGTHAYTALDQRDSDGHRQWSQIDTDGGAGPTLHDLAQKLSISPDFLAQLRTIIEPGTTLVVSDASAPHSAPVDSGVNVLTTDEGSKR